MKKSILIGVALMAVAGVASAGQKHKHHRHHHRPTHVTQVTYNPQTPPRVAAPEIDPASAASALTLLAGGLTLLRGRRRKKQ